MARDWTSFTITIGIKSTVGEMYNAWAKAGEIEKWFLETCTYIENNNTITGSDICVQSGSTYEWTWYLYNIMEKGKVLQANGKDFFQFSFAGDCKVDVRLKETGEHVLVTLTQHNIPTDEESKFNIRIGCLEGWTFYLANLKCFYETGYDLRNKIPELKGVNN